MNEGSANDTISTRPGGYIEIYEWVLGFVESQFPKNETPVTYRFSKLLKLKIK